MQPYFFFIGEPLQPTQKGWLKIVFFLCNARPRTHIIYSKLYIISMRTTEIQVKKVKKFDPIYNNHVSLKVGRYIVGTQVR
jgi:hypothetical protein